ncbi:unnamed protein product, partial [Boreogadus saida]
MGGLQCGGGPGQPPERGPRPPAEQPPARQPHSGPQRPDISGTGQRHHIAGEPVL